MYRMQNKCLGLQTGDAGKGLVSTLVCESEHDKVIFRGSTELRTPTPHEKLRFCMTDKRTFLRARSSVFRVMPD